ncbi:MAG: hypothetical protein FJ291_32800 [Planctomycetes bacterium]|nr:hypothetical protein [Planctomycetota bacterium]
MKVVFVGGGAHRHLGIIRGALARRPVFDGGEIVLYDINRPRAEAMGRMVMKTPEFAEISCKVTWNASLERALDGADAVSVVLMAGSPRSFAFGNLASQKHGFMSSDQLSPNGAFLALKGGPILIPDAFHGTISALATHQTLLGDAIATEDPRVLYHALYAYPVKHNTRAAHALYRDLLEINRDEIPTAFQDTRDYLW